jgi:hypothetical protein
MVYVAAGEYERANAFCNASATVVPTQECAYIAVGGRVTCGTWGALTFALDQGTTYSVARSNAKRVLDWLSKDAYGDYTELTLAASLAACRATPGTWFTDNVTVYVNRSDGAAVTTANTKVLLQAVEGIEMTTSGNMYIEGFDQVGGTVGNVRLRNNATGRFVAKECTFKFSGASTPVDAVQVLNVKLAVFIDCIAAKPTKDGFNFHESGGVEPTGITINCIGRNCGDGSTNSNNGLTYHDGCVGIDVGGIYYGNRGGNCAHTNADTQVWQVGTQSWGSLGDLDISGGTTPPTDYQSIDTAKVFLSGCSGLSANRTLIVSGGTFVDI